VRGLRHQETLNNPRGGESGANSKEEGGGILTLNSSRRIGAWKLKTVGYLIAIGVIVLGLKKKGEAQKCGESVRGRVTVWIKT